MNIIRTIREEIKKSPVTQAEISRRTGINKTALHRVMVQGGTLQAESCDKLLVYFGYELKKNRSKK